MVYSPILGVGKEDSALNAIRSFDSGVQVLTYAGTDNNFSFAIPSRQKILTILITITPNPAGGVPFGSAQNARINISVDGRDVANYAMPSSNEWASNINDQISFVYEIPASGSTLRMQGARDSGQDYNYNIRVVVYATDL